MNYIESDAVFGGKQGEYRYELKRIWEINKEIVTYILLNPSTADKNIDDNTIGSCARLAEHNGFGGFTVVNLFAYRATKPKDLIGYKKDILTGKENDEYILDSVKKTNKIVLGWGNAVKELKNVKDYSRDKEVAELLDKNGYKTHCADLTGKGCPKHPLFISGKSSFFEIKWNDKKCKFER
jgi:hypothetical protein